MSLFALVNGKVFEQALSISVRRSLRNLVSWFDLTASADENEALPIVAGDRIEIVDDARDKLFTGFVEELSVSQSADDHTIRISGRDLAADLVDSSLKVKSYNGPIGLEDLIKKVIGDQGLSLSVVSEAGSLNQLKASDLVNGEVGETAFGFLEKYARHVQAVLTSNGKGEIVILRAGPREGSFSILRQAGNEESNVLSSSIRINTSGRFRDYSCKSQLSPAGKKSSILSKEIEDQGGTATDKDARAGRFYEFETETSADSLTCADRAKLESNVRRAASFEYTATVQGIPEGLGINRLIAARDDLCKVNSVLLVTDLDHDFDLDGGTTTTLRMSYRDAFTLEESVARDDATRSETAEPLIKLGGR